MPLTNLQPGNPGDSGLHLVGKNQHYILNGFMSSNIKQSLTFIFVILFCPVLSYAQDSFCHITKDQFHNYRKGYIIDTKNDTLKGYIYIDSDTSLYFIDAGKKLKITTFAKQSKIPYIPAEYCIIKSFFRNGIVYENCKIPPDNKSVYLSVIDKGAINLYALLSGYSDKRLDDIFANGLFFGILGLMATSYDKSEDEYFNAIELYIQKNPDPNLIRVPRGEKRFRDVFIPLIRDNQNYLTELVGQCVNYDCVKILVHRYNELSTIK
jgi:hypothetical protein